MTKTPVLSVLLCFTLFVSCSKPEPIICFTPPEPVSIRFIGKDGTDLLDPANPKGFKIADIRLSYIIDGKQMYSEVKLDSVPNTKLYFLNTDMSWNADKGRDFTLKLSEGITDSIFLRYDHVTENHCGFSKFVQFKYNNVVFSKEKIADNFWAFQIIR